MIYVAMIKTVPIVDRRLPTSVGIAMARSTLTILVVIVTGIRAIELLNVIYSRTFNPQMQCSTFKHSLYVKVAERCLSNPDT